ncbi:hypothetical protein [Bacillus sp. B15-48]|uniref:hypothetical protein n=1 Tax=Bacillus sp. B15-48 TaxID=1548601 RepID=UPI00193F82C1|nr:hypothetical protein [Bacillus sp. B15-48]MBM4765459.1 hypothetical protein [Bacillus sp. B15-48]
MKALKKLKRKVQKKIYAYMLGGYIAGVITAEIKPLFLSFFENIKNIFVGWWF